MYNVWIQRSPKLMYRYTQYHSLQCCVGVLLPGWCLCTQNNTLNKYLTKYLLLSESAVKNESGLAGTAGNLCLSPSLLSWSMDRSGSWGKNTRACFSSMWCSYLTFEIHSAGWASAWCMEPQWRFVYCIMVDRNISKALCSLTFLIYSLICLMKYML